MKNARSQDTRQNKQMTGHRLRPDVRDDLDSRKNEEQETKGADRTHNEKEVRNNRPRKKED
jgi:hypothetical protein